MNRILGISLIIASVFIKDASALQLAPRFEKALLPQRFYTSQSINDKKKIFAFHPSNSFGRVIYIDTLIESLEKIAKAKADGSKWSECLTNRHIHRGIHLLRYKAKYGLILTEREKTDFYKEFDLITEDALESMHSIFPDTPEDIKRITVIWDSVAEIRDTFDLILGYPCISFAVLDNINNKSTNNE